MFHSFESGLFSFACSGTSFFVFFLTKKDREYGALNQIKT
uniref:Uncharacterized protein n=1 Tax=Rhizophora mucronata TaxID=61149 RepID=A0A2P2PED6_RHIMU